MTKATMTLGTARKIIKSYKEKRPLLEKDIVEMLDLAMEVATIIERHRCAAKTVCRNKTIVLNCAKDVGIIINFMKETQQRILNQ